MATHRPILATGEIYHVYNRTIAKEPAFSSQSSLDRLLDTVDYYRFPYNFKFSRYKALTADQQENFIAGLGDIAAHISIYTFSFMPNHYHFLLKQTQNDGISRFLTNTQNSFAKYYNLIKKRNGGLFQSSFKAKRITTNEEFIHVSRYIHLNHVTAGLVSFEELKSHPWSSFAEYVNGSKSGFIETSYLLNHFRTKQRYEQFVGDHADYQRKLAVIKHLLFAE